MCRKDIRDGTTTDRIPFNEDGENEDPEAQDENGEFLYGKHESLTSFRRCSRRRRNYGLFYADQGNPNADRSARFTRQGNDQTRYGYECPEERDYYPYWHPTEWKDIVVFTSRVERCGFFRANSQNVMHKYWCVGDELDTQNVEMYETDKKCDGKGIWERVESWGLPPPECFPAGWNRDNHLGNAAGGYANSYKWVLPSWATVASESIEDDRDDATSRRIVPCVFRIRYNISTGDFRGGVENRGPSYEQGGFADSRLNGAANSPVTQDPYILYGKHPDQLEDMQWPLVLAINTAQFARTFEERSHLFYIKPLPGVVGGNIFNILVRGKRGNIVQTYPAVEYDFSPNNIQMNVGDFIHFQVTGCDTNPGGNDGEGENGTDRSNMVQIRVGSDKTNRGDAATFGALGNYPVPFESTTMWGTPGTQKALENTWNMAHINQFDKVQCEAQNQVSCCLTLEQLEAKHGGNNNGKQQDPQNCAVLNGRGGNSFDSGLVKMTEAGTFHYMSSRNNNFTNRSQKGTIVVGSVFSVPTMVAMAAGGGAAITGVAVAGSAWSGGGCLSTVAV
jgi:hypothetical protein